MIGQQRSDCLKELRGFSFSNEVGSSRLEGTTCLIIGLMALPIRTCVNCGEEFELRPDKPGFANRCPECSTPEAMESKSNDKDRLSAEERKAEGEVNADRRRAIRDLLYSKDR
jgi:DNA-directed RNA polymerase subunit RPC12/RpoP